jgi:hypothetical protein
VSGILTPVSVGALAPVSSRAPGCSLLHLNAGIGGCSEGIGPGGLEKHKQPLLCVMRKKCMGPDSLQRAQFLK